MASQSEKRETAKNNAKANTAKYAATEYVYKGLDKLGLSYNEQERLAKKFIPLVTQRMEAGTDKTAMRAKIQEVNIKKKAVKQAKKNIQG
jgi:pantothenate kinase-related protein Tda10